jgi:hypothetical protein
LPNKNVIGTPFLLTDNNKLRVCIADIQSSHG